MYGARDLKGWGFTLSHDVEGFEFLGARLPSINLLEKNGSEAPLLLVKKLGDGQTLLVSASTGESVSGDGKIVEAVFGIKGAPERGTFRVEEGVVFDGYRKQSGLLAIEKEVYVTGPAHSTLLGSLIDLFEPMQLPQRRRFTHACQSGGNGGKEEPPVPCDLIAWSWGLF
jgi:hypothetical protein